MRYAVFADVHGNAQALEAVLKALASEKVDAYYCAGDLVGYGADPKECLKLIRAIDAKCVVGNHDWAVARRLDLHRFHEQAQSAVEWTQQQLTEQEQTFLADLPLRHEEKQFVVVHGTLSQPEAFHYLVDQEQARISFSLMNCQICFVGHSHVAQSFVHKRDGSIDVQHKDIVDILPDHKYIVNVGSVGQPRDRDPRAAYAIYDDQGFITIKRVAYEVAAARDKIIRSGLPSALGDRLLQGV